MFKAKAKSVRDANAAPDDAGDALTLVAIADTKIVRWRVGARDFGTATDFMLDLVSRFAARVQITTDRA